MMRSTTTACIIAVITALIAGFAGIVFTFLASGGMPLRRVFSFPAMMTLLPTTFAALTAIFARWNELAARTFGTVAVVVCFSFPIVILGGKHPATTSVLFVFVALSLYATSLAVRVADSDDFWNTSVRGKRIGLVALVCSLLLVVALELDWHLHATEYAKENNSLSSPSGRYSARTRGIYYGDLGVGTEVFVGPSWLPLGVGLGRAFSGYCSELDVRWESDDVLSVKCRGNNGIEQRAEHVGSVKIRYE